MPSFITHQILAEEIQSRLPKTLAEKINNLAAFFLGAQGADPFFTYRPINSRKLNIGKTLHRTNLYDFFSATKNYFAENNDGDALSYILGYITHYAVDVTFHPYVYGLEKELVSALPKSRKKDKVHFLIEKDIDVFLYEEYRKLPIKKYEFPVTFGEKSFEAAYRVLDGSVWEAYSVKLTYNGVRTAMKHFVNYQKFMLDKSGNVRNFLFGFERLFFLPHYFSYFFVRENPDIRFTNYKKELSPLENTDSIYDLAEKAIVLAVKLIKDYLSGETLNKELFSTDMNSGKD